MGAGILPVALHNNKLYFLFGKETFNSSSPGWSDFGGSKENDESPKTTALREGYEESCGFFGSKSQIKKLIKEKLILEIENTNKGGYYKVYLFKYHYDDNLPNYFNNNFKFIKSNLKSLVDSHNGYFEKSEIKWFTKDELIENKKIFRHFYKEILQQILDNYDILLNNIKKI